MFEKFKHLKKFSLKKKDSLWGYVFIAPTMLGFFLFVIGPLIAIFVFSVQERNLLTGQISYIGNHNYYTMLFTDLLFKKTIKNSLVFTAGFVPLDISLGLTLAILLNRLKGRISRFFQVIFFSPVITSAVAWAIVWKFILQGQSGVINQLLSVFGINGPNWLYKPNTAMFAVIFTRSIKVVGLNMVIFLSALTNIPKDYSDAAKVDGANDWHVLRHITLPLLTPTTFMVTIITLIGSLKVFDTIVMLTNGGPSNATSILVYYIYYQAFMIFETGYASSLAVVLFMITFGLTILQWLVRKKWVYEE